MSLPPQRNASSAPSSIGKKKVGRASNHFGHGVTLRDIAGKLGISHVAVSLALRNAPGISEARRQQIQAVAEKMGYQPNANAAALGRRRSATPAPRTEAILAWINCGPELRRPHNNRELALCREGARRAVEQYGYVMEEFAGTTFEKLNHTLRSRNITGILVFFPSALPKNWERFPWQDYSVVHVGNSIARPAFPSVSSDHFSNCLLASEKIRARGYSRVGFVTSRSTDSRFSAGFVTAQFDVPEQQRIPIHFLTNHTNNIIEQQRFDDWIRKHRPDAVLTDVAILPAMLKSASYRVPHDVGLATLNILESRDIAGIDPKPEAVGNAAAEMLVLQLNALNLNIPGSDRQLLIAGKWSHGASLPPRPNAARPV